MPSRPLVFGHKGAAAVAPENTLASFTAALRSDVDGIECDIRASADHVPVVIHDATVDRTTSGTGKVATLTIRELRALDASMGHTDYSDLCIPMLEEVIRLVSGRCLLVLEYKSLDAVAPSVPVIRDLDAASWLTAWSFLPEIVAALRDQLPEVSRSLLVGTEDDWTGKVRAAKDLSCIGVSLRQDFADAERVALARESGLKLYTWTANDPSDWSRLVDVGVDAIVTDDPERLQRYLASA